MSRKRIVIVGGGAGGTETVEDFVPGGQTVFT